MVKKTIQQVRHLINLNINKYKNSPSRLKMSLFGFFFLPLPMDPCTFSRAGKPSEKISQLAGSTRVLDIWGCTIHKCYRNCSCLDVSQHFIFCLDLHLCSCSEEPCSQKNLRFLKISECTLNISLTLFNNKAYMH